MEIKIAIKVTVFKRFLQWEPFWLYIFICFHLQKLYFAKKKLKKVCIDINLKFRYNTSDMQSIDFKNRIFNFLDDITTKYKNQNILIVTYAGLSLYVREYFEGVPTNNDYSLYKLENFDYLEYNN